MSFLMAGTKDANEPMGRKKKPRVDGEKPRVVALKGTGAWHAWVNNFAKFRRVDVTVLVEHALIESAKTHGFDEPPPERIA